MFDITNKSISFKLILKLFLKIANFLYSRVLYHFTFYSERTFLDKCDLFLFILIFPRFFSNTFCCSVNDPKKMSNTLVDSQQPQQLPKLNGSSASTPTTTNGQSVEEPIVEGMTELFDWNIGYERYGHGPVNFLFICGGVG